MPRFERPTHPVERLNEIRALGDHISYAGLLQWFMSLPAAPPEEGLPARRRALDSYGGSHDVRLFRGPANRELASVCLTKVEDRAIDPTRVFFRGLRRFVYVRDESGPRPRLEPREVLNINDPNVALVWRQTEENRYDLKTTTTDAGGVPAIAPLFATVITPEPLTVETAEEILLATGTALSHPQPTTALTRYDDYF